MSNDSDEFSASAFDLLRYQNNRWCRRVYAEEAAGLFAPGEYVEESGNGILWAYDIKATVMGRRIENYVRLHTMSEAEAWQRFGYSPSASPIDRALAEPQYTRRQSRRPAARRVERRRRMRTQEDAAPLYSPDNEGCYVDGVRVHGQLEDGRYFLCITAAEAGERGISSTVLWRPGLNWIRIVDPDNPPPAVEATTERLLDPVRVDGFNPHGVPYTYTTLEELQAHHPSPPYGYGWLTRERRWIMYLAPHPENLRADDESPTPPTPPAPTGPAIGKRRVQLFDPNQEI